MQLMLLILIILGVATIVIFGALVYLRSRDKRNAIIWYHPENLEAIRKCRGLVRFTTRKPPDDVPSKFLDFSIMDKIFGSRPVWLWKQDKFLDKKTGEIIYQDAIYSPMYSGTMTPAELHDDADWSPAKRYLTISKKLMQALQLGTMGMILIGTLFMLFMIGSEMAKKQPPVG